MRVRVRNTAAGPWGVICAGKTGNVPDEVGVAMVAAREAVEIKEEKPRPIVEAETATAEPEQETTAMVPPRRRRRHAEVS